LRFKQLRESALCGIFSGGSGEASSCPVFRFARGRRRQFYTGIPVFWAFALLKSDGLHGGIDCVASHEISAMKLPAHQRTPTLCFFYFGSVPASC
jgi:hypothetical protein